jgi:N-acetylglutamate synthase
VNRASAGSRAERVTPPRYLLEVRLAEGDAGSRVVIRWRRPAAEGREEVADVLGVLESVGAVSFTVRKASGELVTIPRDRALAGKTVAAAPRRDRRQSESDAGESPAAARVGRSCPRPDSAA